MGLINNRRPLTRPRDDLWRDPTSDPPAAARRVPGQRATSSSVLMRVVRAAYSIRHV